MVRCTPANLLTLCRIPLALGLLFAAPLSPLFFLFYTMVLASGDPDHILSGVTNHYLSGNWEPIDGVSDCQQPRLANCLFLRRHRLNGLYLTGL